MTNVLDDTPLEATIDKYGIAGVLAAVAAICALKATHIAENWQDTPLAVQWAELGRQIEKIVPKAVGL